jgi:protein phosphatase
MRIQVVSYPIYEIGQRSNQEDSLFPPLEKVSSTGSLYILCDGMGGHAAGEVASQTVCSAMSSFILSHHTEGGVFEENDFSKALEFAYTALNGRDTDDEKKMGTTLAFVMFHSGGCFVAHIGDSRVYHIRPSANKILFVTRDHSLVNELVELGELSKEEARTSRQKNVITRAMQPHQDHFVSADCTNLTDLREGDFIYMCSDGMLEQMEDHEIVNILSLRKPDQEKIRILKGATKDNKDNHSAHLIRILSVSGEDAAAPDMEEIVKKDGHRVIWFTLAAALFLVICIALYVFMKRL